MRALMAVAGFIGSAFRSALVGVLALALILSGVALADYFATQGAGTSFASVVIGTTHYLANLLCDATVGETTCVAVKGAGASATTSDAALVTTLSPSTIGLTTGQSNASSGVATGAANLPTIGYLYGYNGTTWDQLQVDGAKNLKVSSAGAQSNATSGVATSATNAQSVSWLYAFNGATWDQLQDDASKNLNVNINAMAAISIDPCQKTPKSFVAISQAASAQLITGTAGKKTYICSFAANGADTENMSLVEGTGSVCGTNTYALIGSTTASAGMNFAANSGLAQGNGQATIAAGTGDSNATAANVCLLQSGTGRVAGVIGFVQQ